MPLWCLLVAVQQACYGATLLLVASASIFDKQVRGVVEMQQLLWGGGLPCCCCCCSCAGIEGLLQPCL